MTDAAAAICQCTGAHPMSQGNAPAWNAAWARAIINWMAAPAAKVARRFPSPRVQLWFSGSSKSGRVARLESPVAPWVAVLHTIGI
jgi:hypothetical protein